MIGPESDVPESSVRFIAGWLHPGRSTVQPGVIASGERAAAKGPC
jgi:hypothetical protein